MWKRLRESPKSTLSYVFSQLKSDKSEKRSSDCEFFELAIVPANLQIMDISKGDLAQF